MISKGIGSNPMFLIFILIIYNVLGQPISQYWIVNTIVESIIDIVITKIYNHICSGGLITMIKKTIKSASIWGCEELVYRKHNDM